MVEFILIFYFIFICLNGILDNYPIKSSWSNLKPTNKPCGEDWFQALRKERMDSLRGASNHRIQQHCQLMIILSKQQTDAQIDFPVPQGMWLSKSKICVKSQFLQFLHSEIHFTSWLWAESFLPKIYLLRSQRWTPQNVIVMVNFMRN